MTKSEKTVQHMFKCKEPKMMAYKKELYKHIYTWLKDQDTHHMLLDMIMTTLSKNHLNFNKNAPTSVNQLNKTNKI